MSNTAVQEFLTKVSEDQALQEELAKAMEAEDDRQAVTDLAQSKGYSFTADELWQEIQARQAEAQQRQESGELSEEELEAVAGGEFLIATSTAVGLGLTAAGVGYAIGGGLGQKIKW
ncbi:Nif11-like leader peptide family natural product precursor [Leptothermofonsia sichuanensis E412]|jgi:predicted ribosomally synthesized peptide with nif11-like leader|uniref:Nif11-like leader peptide family natural product precursor n=1 Tax=Leptothermofonsia sichuanensis TaxID=2917832 RepID=UPI001CA71DF7|nr:Nif11-like leader peptide family natural product precursor [Leptothermofonsia sichuanensis]QZZ21560.1 Nif11-like leader peptide family natural product precursor [Leptothermofonsia sichuanensis E412]